MLNILASVSQWEREIIAERTREVMRHKQKHGEYLGGHIPYGFEVINGALVANGWEQQVIQQAQNPSCQRFILAQGLGSLASAVPGPHRGAVSSRSDSADDRGRRRDR